MDHYTGRIVRAEAGRDQNGLFFVMGMAGTDLLLADGKRRKSARPKRKNQRHVQPMDAAQWNHPTVRKLQQGEPVSDRELRRALAAFKEGITFG